MIYAYLRETLFGKCLIAIRHNAIIALLFGKNDRDLEDELNKMFPEGTIFYEHRNEHYQAVVDFIVLSRINNYDRDYKIAFNIDFQNGTSFQKRIWETLRNLPEGSTLSYQEVAEQAGFPKAVRAAASAVSKNPISILVPCHRVLPKSKKLGNYRYGARMKQILLDRENNENKKVSRNTRGR